MRKCLVSLSQSDFQLLYFSLQLGAGTLSAALVARRFLADLSSEAILVTKCEVIQTQVIDLPAPLDPSRSHQQVALVSSMLLYPIF